MALHEVPNSLSQILGNPVEASLKKPAEDQYDGNECQEQKVFQGDLHRLRWIKLVGLLAKRDGGDLVPVPIGPRLWE